MADTDNRALEAFEAFMKTEAPSDYDASNGDAWYVWKACWAAAIASRPAEVDDERQWVVVGGRRAGRTFLSALARDAERYRWMRNAQWFKAGIAKTELNASSFHYSGDLLDQLVDAGRVAGVNGEGAGK